ncbi:MAG: peptidoglycan editing factor PgeF [Syntrophaceae bacterium]
MEAAPLSAYDFVTHAFCTRKGGTSTGKFSSLNFSIREGDSAENVRQNWEVLAEAFNMETEQFFVVNQVHGDSILLIDQPVRNIGIHQPHKYDAIITDQQGLAIGIKTADCVPIFFVDTVKNIVGVAHAGWRGTAMNIAVKVVKTLMNRFSSHADDIIAVIGPAIGACCYQVDEIVFNAMEKHNNRDAVFHACLQEGQWMLDLPLANKLQIIGSGISQENVFTADYCTSCNTDIWYSHRGEGGNTGRQLNFIMLK